MKSTTTSRKEYTARWNEHINNLSGLGWNLDERADREAVRNMQVKLREIVDKAALKQPEL